MKSKIAPRISKLFYQDGSSSFIYTYQRQEFHLFYDHRKGLEKKMEKLDPRTLFINKYKRFK